MQRIYQGNEKGFVSHLELSRQTAFHEAGHAAAIHLENQRKNLPDIYFEIHTRQSDRLTKSFGAKIDGGRLIADPGAIRPEIFSNNSESATICGLELACDADMINLMAGPLAEAKYVSIRDQEPFNIDLLSPHALLNYGGSHDLDQVWCYLDCFDQSPKQREDKLNQLLVEAFRFVQQPHRWKSITGLAHYLLHSTEAIISCEKAGVILDRQYPYANIHWL